MRSAHDEDSKQDESAVVWESTYTSGGRTSDFPSLRLGFILRLVSHASFELLIHEKFENLSVTDGRHSF